MEGTVKRTTDDNATGDQLKSPKVRLSSIKTTGRSMREGAQVVLPAETDVIRMDEKPKREAKGDAKLEVKPQVRGRTEEAEDDHLNTESCVPNPTGTMDTEAPTSLIYSDDKDFRKALNNLRKEKAYTDVQILCQNKIYHAHRHVLACGSKYFYRQFVTGNDGSGGESPGSTQPASNIELHEHDPEILEYIIHFLYTGSLPDLRNQSTSNLRMLIKTGEYLQVDNFEITILQALLKDISLNNFSHIINLANKLNNQAAINRVINFLIKNLDSVWVSADFMELTEPLVTRIFCQAAEELPSHDTLLQVSLVWAKNRVEERKDALTKLAGSLDFSRVSPSLARFLLHDHFIITSKTTLRDELVKVLAASRDESYEKSHTEPIIPAVHATNNLDSCLPANGSDTLRSDVSLVVIGRDDGNRASVIRYYPRMDNWDELQDLGTSLESKPGLGYHQEKIFFIGGEAINQSKLGCCYVFDLKLKSMTRLPDLIIPRSLPIVFGYGDSIYTAGGMGRFSHGGLSSVECLETPDTAMWKYRHPMKEKRDQTAVCCYLDGKVFVAGGGSFKCEYFVPGCKAWQQVCPLPSDEFMGIFPLFSVANNRLYAFKYYKPNKAMFLDLERDEWMAINVRGSPPEWVMAAVGWGSAIYAIDKSRRFHVLDSTTGSWAVGSKLPKSFLHPTNLAVSFF